MIRALVLVLASSLTFATGCRVGVDNLAEAVEPKSLAAPDAAHPADLVSGVVLADSAEAFEPGDEVLLEIKSGGPGGVEVLLLHVRLTRTVGPRFAGSVGEHEFETLSLLAELTLYDRSGREVDRAEAPVPIGLLDAGMIEFARARTIDEPRVARALARVLALVSSAPSNEIGLRVFQRLLTPWQLLAAQRKVSFSAASRTPQPRPAIHGREAFEIDVGLSISGRIAVSGAVVALDPHAPLGLTAGVWKLSLQNTVDPTRRVEMRVLAAKHGGEPEPLRLGLVGP